MAKPSVDPDIRKAKTLPADFYIDPAWFELSKEKIFARSWHFLGRRESFHDLTPFELLPGILDEPVLVSLSGDDLICVSNVCTHRGKILIERPCSGSLIRCGYHGRRFSLKGKFLSMPEFEGVEEFPSEADNLPRIAIAEKAGFVFASLDPIAEFEDFVHGAEGFDTVIPALDLTARREYEVDAHWALYCENYLEGFHIPYVHKGLNAVVDYESYSTETFRFSSLQKAWSVSSLGTDRGDAVVAARYLFVFPNMMFNFYPWGVSVNVVRPVSPSKTIVEFLTYVGDENLLDQGAGANLHTVEMEDEAVVESVQKGIRSRFYSQGRYSPTREQGTHHFHRLIAEFMD